MSGKDFEIKKNVVDYAAKLNDAKIKSKIDSTEAVSLGLLSVFDANKENKNDKEFTDGKVTEEEFLKISPQEYNQYIKEMKKTLSNENGRGEVERMAIPTYDEFYEMLENGDVDLSKMKNYIKEKNPQFKEEAYFNPFDEKKNSKQTIKDRYEGSESILSMVHYKGDEKPEDLMKSCQAGEDVNFNKACIEADKVFKEFDANKDKLLDKDEETTYLMATPEGQKAEKAFMNADKTNDCKLSRKEEKEYLNEAEELPLKEQQAYDARLNFSENLDPNSAKTKGQVIADLYIKNVKEEKHKPEKSKN